LSRDSLSIPYSDAASFTRAVGQGRVESSLGFKNQSFYGGSIDEVKKRVTKEMLEATFANPTAIDNFLGVPGGTTEKLAKGELSPDAYNSLVGGVVLKQELYVYTDPQKRAEAFDVSRGDLEALLSGHSSAFAGMGKYTVAKALTASNEQQAQLISWFNTQNKPQNLDPDYLGGQFGLREGDLAKIFVDNLPAMVFERQGNAQALNNLQGNSPLASYLAPVKELRFYTDRINIIKDNFSALKNNSSDPDIRAKAGESEQVASSLLSNPSISGIKSKVKTLQTNLQFIEDKAKKDDPKSLDRTSAIKKALNEIIEGQELNSFDSLSPDSITSQTDPQVGLTKKDVLAILTGKKTVDEVAVNIGFSKWEVELDLPSGSLSEVYKGLKASGFADSEETILISIGKAKVRDYGGAFGRDPLTVDKDLGLPSGTTADFRAGKISENAYYKRVGMGSTASVAANLLNKQLDLTSDPYYALNGGDVSKMLSGGWFWTALKVGGKAMDDALGFPAGGTMDVIQQAGDSSDLPELLAEKKLGIMAGLDHPVSINGDIPYNLGRTKIEQELWLSPNQINDSNLAAKIQEYTGGNQDSLSRLDMTFGLKAEDSRNLLAGKLAPHDYITKVGDYLKTSVIYDQIANYAPQLKDKDLKQLSLALANQTGSSQEILEAAGANRVGQMLGLDFPVSIRGNFKDNLGEGLIEDRLGLKNGSFKDSLDAAVASNGQQKFESAFYIDNGQLSEARNASSSYWQETYHKNYANMVDSILNISSGSTFDFLTGKIDLGSYVDRAGRSTMNEVTVDKLADFMGLDDSYKFAAISLVEVFNTDPSLSSPASKIKLYNSLIGVAGLDLDSKTKFDPGTWQKIIFVDPADPLHTGPKHAKETLLEQGKRYMPKWLGLDPQWEPYMDLIYEKGTGINNEIAMRDAIKQITGIADDNDAGRFLHGDLKGGIYSWGAAQIVSQYNQEFQGTGSQLDYYTVKTAYFNDPAGENVVAEKAIEDFKKECGGCEISPDQQDYIRDQAISDSRDKAKKQVQYSVIDMQLHKLDKNIPPGFTLAMKEGSSEQKWTMSLSYVGNVLHSENNNIPPEIANDLNKYFDPNSPSFHDASALSSSTYAFLDTQMKTWFGDFIQPGTAKALFEFGSTGKLGTPSDQGSLTQIYANYGINIVANWADSKFGLPLGSTKVFYDYFTKYQAAAAAYHKAQVAYQAAKTAENLQALNKSTAAVDAIKAEAITFVINSAFQKQLVAVDQKLGLVPGSSAMIVGMAAQFWITGGVSPITIGLFILTNLFGVYRVDVTCTACGYYPEMGGSPGWVLGHGNISQILHTANICPLGEFNGQDQASFRQGTVKAAQWKVNQLIADVLNIDDKTKDKNLLPTQIMTLRQDDVDSFSTLLNNKYGLPASRGNSGLWANPLMWDHIHIGY